MNKGFLLRFLIGLMAVFAIAFATHAANAQSTEFTYQGRLLDNTLPPTANYDFQFSLWDSLTSGTQQGSTQSVSGVAVTNGIFTVRLNFGAQFPGAARFLQIAVKPASGPTYTTLAPRQSLTSAPYAVRSANANSADTATTATNATQLGGVAASQFVQNGDPRLTDDRDPLPGSTNYIQNTNAVQAGSNFNIAGTGTANVLNAATQFNLGTNRFLTETAGGLFLGLNSGAANPTGIKNTFVGNGAGGFTTTGFNNTFVGYQAGDANITGNNLTTIGHRANAASSSTISFATAIGAGSTVNTSNTIVLGRSSGADTVQMAGHLTVGGSGTFGNSLFVTGEYNLNGAPIIRTPGTNNLIVGRNAGDAYSSGLANSYFGSQAGVATADGGSNAFFGYSAGFSNVSGDQNSFFGTNAGYDTTGNSNTFLGYDSGITNSTGSNNTVLGARADVAAAGLNYATAIGAGATVTNNNTIVLGRSTGVTRDTVRIPGVVVVGTLGSAGSTQLCQNGADQIATCSSSLRYKTNITKFLPGMSFVNRLQPISYEWIDGGLKDVGFGAEDIARIDPRFVTFNRAGEVEGVKYDRLSVAFVNALKEQQSIISSQSQQISEQEQKSKALEAKLQNLERQLIELKKIMCLQNPAAEICKEGK